MEFPTEALVNQVTLKSRRLQPKTTETFELNATSSGAIGNSCHTQIQAFSVKVNFCSTTD
jgi:hypothetical protein